MGKKSQEQTSGMTYEQRVEAAKARQEEERKKQAEEATKAVVGGSRSQIQGPDVDMKPEEAIEAKVAKQPQMSFGQKIEMLRSMRSRKRHREKLTPSFSPNVKVPEKGIKTEEIAKDLEDYKATGTITGVDEGIKYRCKDCKETFEGVISVDKCMFCDSKKIEVVKDAKKDQIET